MGTQYYKFDIQEYRAHKKQVRQNLKKRTLRIKFYVDHMMEEDLWPTEGKVFMNYLDDLSKARNIDWRINLKEMELDRYDPR